MLSTLQNFDYNGQLIQRRDDGYINLTQMCQANGKRLDNWARLKSTTSYLTTLSNSLGSEVVYSEEGLNGGTWGHPSAAINLARWLSDDFAIWCDAHIFVLMETGQTSLAIDPIEEMRLRIQLAEIEKEKSVIELKKVEVENKTLNLRNSIVQLCPQPVADRILGVTEVKEIEYRDRVIMDGAVINDGATLTKTELCNRYKVLTRNGKPDFRRLNGILDRMGVTEKSEAWELSAVIKENYQLKREYLPMLDQLVDKSDRQLWLGE